MAQHEQKYQGMSTALSGVLASMTIITSLLFYAGELFGAETTRHTWLIMVTFRILVIAVSISFLAGVSLLYLRIIERARQREAAAVRESYKSLFDAIDADLSLHLKEQSHECRRSAAL